MIFLFFAARKAFIQFMLSIGLRKALKNLEPKRELEFIYSMYYTLCLVISVSIGEYATRSELWRVDVDHCFIGWPTHTFPLSHKFYYTFAFAFYAYSLILVAFVEEKKKDYWAMVLHHMVTCTTIFLSGQYDLARIGAVILLTFDICDIFLETAKLFSKIKEDVPATLTFVIFTGLWIRNRLYFFPLYVIPAIVNAEDLSGHEVPYLPVHVTIMITLFILNVYWSYFIAKKLLGFIKNGTKKEMDDPREKSQRVATPKSVPC